MKMHLNLQLKIVRWSLAPLALWLCCGRVAAPTPVVDRNSIAGTTVLHTSHSISPRLRLEASYARLPLVFEPNQGQCDSRAKYLARGNGYTLFLTLQGDSDAFVTMIDPTGASIVYSTYLGGDGDENYKQPTADLFGSIAVGASGA